MKMHIKRFDPAKCWKNASPGDSWLWGVFFKKESPKPIAASPSFERIAKLRRWNRWKRIQGS